MVPIHPKLLSCAELRAEIATWLVIAILRLRARQPYTIYGTLRDKNGGRMIECKVVVFGRMIEVGENEFQRGQLVDQDHRIAEITHYELWEDKAEVYYYDFFGSVWRVNGVNQLAQTNSILRIA